jgi:serine phosphatase RsbU (regulator of sigma subunit)
VDVLSVVNEALLRDTPEEDFCTAIYASLSVAGAAPTLRLAVGGHPLPLLASNGNGDVAAVGRPGTVLGAVADPVLHDDEIRLGPDDLLLLYTDGVVESRTPDGRLGLDGLGALLTRCTGMGAGAVTSSIEAAIVGEEELDSPQQRDDVALLALRAHHAEPQPRGSAAER